VRDGATLEQAARVLESTFEGTSSALTVVLAGYDGDCAYARFDRVEELTPEPPAQIPSTEPLLVDAEWDMTGREYRGAVSETRERIAAGDVYVLNLTARLEGTMTSDSPKDAFEALRTRAAADMAAFVDGLPGAVPWLACVSPERFLRIRRDSAAPGAAHIVEVCPIKGTRPRATTPEADAAVAVGLAFDVKEHAEHVMIVDLERNDIGVACAPGTVYVEPMCEVVATPYCHQMVSTVRGALRADASFAELLSATFPCGSVTGAPKSAAMRIIGELEATPRGAYCGALIVAIPGELDSAVLIRTLEGAAEKPGLARWGAGCGITHDSDASAEYLEMLLKASPVTGDRAPDQALRETMRVTWGLAPLLDRHLARLASGGAGPSALARVRAAVAKQLASSEAQCESCRLGITLTPDGEVASGITHEPSSLEVEGGPVALPVEVAEPPELPVNAAKPASRRFWDRAHRVAARAGAHQAILHLPDGTLVDGSTANVWLVTAAGELLTPLAPPAVSGVCRQLVFDVADEIGIAASERTVTLADYKDAAEVWLSNAVGGFVPVRDRKGPVGERIAERVKAAFAAE
jgi:para-aminobenzoate synthetase/4-amino-4-deoxychorismate lyase